MSSWKWHSKSASYSRSIQWNHTEEKSGWNERWWEWKSNAAILMSVHQIKWSVHKCFPLDTHPTLTHSVEKILHIRRQMRWINHNEAPSKVCFSTYCCGCLLFMMHIVDLKRVLEFYTLLRMTSIHNFESRINTEWTTSSRLSVSCFTSSRGCHTDGAVFSLSQSCGCSVVGLWVKVSTMAVLLEPTAQTQSESLQREQKVQLWLMSEYDAC